MGSEAKRREVHVVVGCSDARDVGATFTDALEAARTKYRGEGTEIEFHALRTAGSFVTRDVIDDLRRIVELNERRTLDTVRYFVHLQTHGEVEEDVRAGLTPMERLAIVQGSPFNCGMLGAASVAVELERLILRARPTMAIRGRTRAVETEDDIRALLFDVHAHRGAIAGDWIRSIDDLRTHPRLQESVLREAIATDRTLRSVDLAITTGIQDYRKHAYFRLDAHPEVRTFWDDVYVELRARTSRLPDGHDEIAQRTAVQAPELGLFSTCDAPDVRRAAVTHLATVLGREPSVFGPNRVFTFASESFDLPHSPFGPYTVAGFFYAVAHLRLRNFVVLGHDEAQTERMLRRLGHDPFVHFIAESFDVAFHAAASCPKSDSHE